LISLQHYHKSFFQNLKVLVQVFDMLLNYTNDNEI